MEGERSARHRFSHEIGAARLCVQKEACVFFIKPHRNGLAQVVSDKSSEDINAQARPCAKASELSQRLTRPFQNFSRRPATLSSYLLPGDAQRGQKFRRVLLRFA